MSNQFCYVPTGERRPPRKGEWFQWDANALHGGPLCASKDFSLEYTAIIYRRVPFAVVQGLVDALELARGIVEQETDCGTKEFCDALAAASAAGIGAANG